MIDCPSDGKDVFQSAAFVWPSSSTEERGFPLATGSAVQKYWGAFRVTFNCNSC